MQRRKTLVRSEQSQAQCRFICTPPESDDRLLCESQKAEVPRLDSRYTQVELIGKGGMGSVYKVFDQSLGTRLALKVLHSGLRCDQATEKRIELEVAAASKLTHPNLVTTYGIGKTLDNAPYVVMNFLEGESLAEVLKREGSITTDRALALASQICEALSYAHENGVVHLDIKPSNIIVSSDELSETAHIVDFGISKVLMSSYSEAVTLTQTGPALGSPQYMSPEQCLDLNVDGRSDIYSFGCTLYEMLTGAPPFSGNNPVKIIVQHIHEEAMPFCNKLKGDLKTKRLEQVVLRCLDKDPECRYQSMNEVFNEVLLIDQGKAPRQYRRKRKEPSGSAPSRILMMVLFSGAAVLYFSRVFDSQQMKSGTYDNLILSMFCLSFCFTFLPLLRSRWNDVRSGFLTECNFWRLLLYASLSTMAISVLAFSACCLLIGLDRSFNWCCGGIYQNAIGTAAAAFVVTVVSAIGSAIFRKSESIGKAKLIAQFISISAVVIVLASTAMPAPTARVIFMISTAEFSRIARDFLHAEIGKLDPAFYAHIRENWRS